MLSKKTTQKMLKYYIELKISELEERVYCYIKNDTDHASKYKNMFNLCNGYAYALGDAGNKDTLTNELNVHYFKDGCILRKDRYMERCTKNKVKLFLYSNIYYLLNRLPTNIIGINNYSYLQDELNKLLLQIEGGNY